MGIVLNYLTTLEVIGRKSGRTILLPVVIAIHDGERYLVSMLGESVQWVQNVRASGGKAVLPGGGREDVLLEDPPGSVRLS
jgi:F420H(2)-dependent quinone reductase